MRLEMGECVARFVPRSLTPRDTDLPKRSRTIRSALLQKHNAMVTKATFKVYFQFVITFSFTIEFL